MPTPFPNGQDCEQLAYAPESIRFYGIAPFIPDPLWYRARWFEDRAARPRRTRGRAYHRLVIAGLCAALLAGGSLAFSQHRGVTISAATHVQNGGSPAPHLSGPSGIGIG